ncbi:MAG: DUF2158 domain-containing protein [Labrys sp. (in: a-proteobacteria)]
MGEHQVISRVFNEHSFRPGDLCRLKGNGPVMTVTSSKLSENNVPHVGTIWFDQDDRLQQGFFATVLVVPTAKPEGAPR